MPIALPVWFVVDDRSIALMTPAGSLPAAAQAYYASQVFLRFVPDDRILTWDDARLGVK
jgi:hypothetical protein